MLKTQLTFPLFWNLWAYFIVKATCILCKYVTKNNDKTVQVVKCGGINIETYGLVDLQTCIEFTSPHWQQVSDSILKHKSIALVVWLLGRMISAHILA